MSFTIRHLWLFIAAITFTGGCGSTAPEQPPQKMLLVSFDGFRYDYLQKTDTPNFDRFISEGVKAESLKPIFPTKTFPNHYTTVTGLYPQNSGLVGNTMYDPKWDKWYRIRDRQAVENGKWYFGEPIWNTAEKQGLATGTMFWVGSEADIQDMHPSYWKTYDGSMSERARIDTVVSWFSREHEPIDFGTLYFELVDSQGHRYGTTSDSLVAAIQKSDRLIGYLRQQLEQHDLWQDMNIILVSDHGMVDLEADKTILLDEIINMENVDRYILDPMTMIQPKEGRVDQVYNRLKESENHYRVYKKDELPNRFHLQESRRITDLVMIAEMPYTILLEENLEQFRDGFPRGTHGYDNDEKKMHAFFAARGPAFKTADTVGTFRNTHVYELMAHLLDIDPAPTDGSLDSVKVLLKN